MKEIAITLKILVDDDVYEQIKDKPIRLQHIPYAMVGKDYLHRIVANAGSEAVVDHKNRNKLDNRRQNLRIVSCSENNLNREPSGLIPYKGVQFNKSGNSYVAYVSYNREAIRVNANTALEAAVVRDYLVRKMGITEFTELNIPEVVLDDETAELLILKRNTGKAAKENHEKEVYFRPAQKRKDTGRWVYNLTFKCSSGSKQIKTQDKLEAIYLYWLYLGDVQRSSKALQRWKAASRVGSNSEAPSTIKQ